MEKARDARASWAVIGTAARRREFLAAPDELRRVSGLYVWLKGGLFSGADADEAGSVGDDY